METRTVKPPKALPNTLRKVMPRVVYFVYLLISAYVPGGTQDRLLKASLDGSVLVVGRL